AQPAEHQAVDREALPELQPVGEGGVLLIEADRPAAAPVQRAGQCDRARAAIEIDCEGFVFRGAVARHHALRADIDEHAPVIVVERVDAVPRVAGDLAIDGYPQRAEPRAILGTDTESAAGDLAGRPGGEDEVAAAAVHPEDAGR